MLSSESRQPGNDFRVVQQRRGVQVAASGGRTMHGRARPPLTSTQMVCLSASHDASTGGGISTESNLQAMPV